MQINALNPFFRAQPHSSSHVNVLWNKKEFVYFCWLYNYDYWLIRNIYWGKYFLWEITRCEDWDWHWFHWRQQLFWSCTNCKALFSCPNTALYCRWLTEPLLILEHNTSQLVVRELPMRLVTFDQSDGGVMTWPNTPVCRWEANRTSCTSRQVSLRPTEAMLRFFLTILATRSRLTNKQTFSHVLR